jgi:hypothetical protein
MYPLGKPISQITAEDLARVRDNKYPENLYFDFKQSYDGGGELKIKRELLKDIVAMANTAGGVIIIGGVESDEDPETGIKHLIGYNNIKDASKLAEKYANWIREHTDDILFGVDIVPIEVEGKSVLLIEVPDSPHKPHRVSIKNDPSESYVRIGTSNIPMTMNMVKHMIMSQGSYWADCKGWAEEVVNGVGHVGPCWILLIYPFDVRRRLFKAPDRRLLEHFRPPASGVGNQKGPSFDEQGCYYSDNDVDLRFYRNGAYRIVMQADYFADYEAVLTDQGEQNYFKIYTSVLFPWFRIVDYIMPILLNHLKADMDGFISARYLTTPSGSYANSGPAALAYKTPKRHAVTVDTSGPRDIVLEDEGFRSVKELSKALKDVMLSLFHAFGLNEIPSDTWNYFEQPWIDGNHRFHELSQILNKQQAK